MKKALKQTDFNAFFIDYYIFIKISLSVGFAAASIVFDDNYKNGGIIMDCAEINACSKSKSLFTNKIMLLFCCVIVLLVRVRHVV